MKSAFLLAPLLLVAPPAAAEGPAYQAGQVRMLMSKDDFSKRLDDFKGFMDFAAGASQVVEEFMNEKDPARGAPGEVTLAVMPSGKACFWTAFQDGKPLAAEAELTARLAKLPVPKVRGPIVFAVAALPEGAAEVPATLPAAWRKAGARQGAPVDAIVKQLCGDDAH